MTLKQKKKTGWGDRALSKTLFKGKFGLTDEQLRQAILEDEVQVKTSDGVTFCQWRELKDVHMDERETNAGVSLEPKKITGAQAAQMAMLFDSVSMERPDPTAEELAAASASIPSTFREPAAAPPMQAIEDAKPEEPATPERLNPKEWEQAEGLLKKAEAAVEKLKKDSEREREREREREGESVCVGWEVYAVAQGPVFKFCILHQHYEGCCQADREDQGQQRRPPHREAAPWLLFLFCITTHETTDAVPCCAYKEERHPNLVREEGLSGERQELPGPQKPRQMKQPHISEFETYTCRNCPTATRSTAITCKRHCWEQAMVVSWGVVCSVQKEKPFIVSMPEGHLCEKTVEEMAGVKGQLSARGL